MKKLPWPSRAEYLALMVASALLLLLHAREVQWHRAVATFVLVDLIGYVPGALAFRRARRGPIAAVYHHLYNVTHNFLTAAVVIVTWAALGGGLEWAMLALPLHLAGDRGIFGNGWKPSNERFQEPAVEVAR